jgi:signal transduction histidine kinase
MRRRTEQLAARNRLLRQRIVKRKTAAEALKKNGEHQKKLLKESVRLQQRLRRLTRLLLQTQENEREKISRALNDEIAQLLLGINARVLSLKADAAMSTKGRQKEIASTQRLVASSAKTMHRVVRGFERGSQAARPRKPAHEHSMKWSRPILRAQVTGP